MADSAIHGACLCEGIAFEVTPPTKWRAHCHPGETHVARASLPGDIDRAPSVHVYFEERVGWLDAHDDLTKLGGSSGMEPSWRMRAAARRCANP